MSAKVDVLAIPLSKRLLWVVGIVGFGWFLGFPFHYFGVGDRFTPLFIPLGIASFLVEPVIALLVGFLLPVLSALITGEPPFTPPIVWLVAGEAVMYGFVISFCYHHYKWSRYVSLLAGIILGKIELLCYVLIAGYLMPNYHGMFTWHSVLHGLPGSLLALVLVPVIAKWIESHSGPSNMANA